MPHAAIVIRRATTGGLSALLAELRTRMDVLAAREVAPSSYFVLGDRGDAAVAVAGWRSAADAREALVLLSGRTQEHPGTGPTSGQVGEVVAEAGTAPALAAHGRLGVFTVRPQLIGDVLTRIETGLLPLTRSQPGFCRGVVIRGAGDTSVLVCHAYASEAESEAAGAISRPWVAEHLDHLTVSLDRYHGDIVWVAG
jgi:hypothetical protein